MNMVLTQPETLWYKRIVAVMGDKVRGRLHMRSALPNALDRRVIRQGHHRTQL
jgi:hypothetical protein